MAIVTSDFLAGLFTNYRAIWQKSLQEAFAANNDWKMISTMFTSTTDKETYAWLGEVPNMTEWIDKRQENDLEPFDYTLTNKKYEATITVQRDTIEDDKYNMLAPRIKGLAMEPVRFINEKVFSQLDDGETLLAYDGTAFFSDTRVIGSSANIENVFTGSYNASAANIRSGIALGQETMRLFQSDKGKPLNIMGDTIVCAPEMEIPIKDALIPGVAGTTRPEMQFVKNIIVSPWLDIDGTDWYYLCTKNIAVLPILFQNRKNPEFTQLTNPNTSDRVFDYAQFRYGVDQRFAVGYGDPRCAIKLKA